MKKKETAPPNKKKTSVPLTRKGLIIWISLTFVASAWMFVLGIIVGRGTAPVKFDIEKLQKELALLRETGIMKELRKYKIDTDVERHKTEMGFYETLKDAKKDVELKVDERKQPDKSLAEDKDPETKKIVISENITPKKLPKENKISESNPFTIQVASLRDPKKANEMVAELKQKGYPAYRITAEIPGKGTWYRVRVGSYKGKAEANSMLGRLNKNRVKGMVVLR